MNDLTILYYTANVMPEDISQKIRTMLAVTADVLGLPIVSVSQKPIDFGQNYVLDVDKASIWNLYSQVLLGAENAQTKYVVMCEDDCLYSPLHFGCARPNENADFIYNTNRWSICVWERKPIFSQRNRKVFSQLIANREALIRSMKDRLAIRERGLSEYYNAKIVPHMGEPGRYEGILKIPKQTFGTFHAPLPNVVFDHMYGFQAQRLGKRKRHGPELSFRVKPWGDAENLIQDFWGRVEWEKQQNTSF